MLCWQDCVVGIVTRLRAGRSGAWIPTEARDFSVLQKNIQTGSGAHPMSYWMGTHVFFPWGEVANSMRLNIWLCLVLRVRMSELCLRVWTGTTLPFNFHLGSWVHEQPILIKWSLTCRNPRFQLTVMVLFHSRWLFCACSILNVIAVCCSIAYDWAVLSGAFFNPKPTTLCKKIPGWRLHHFYSAFYMLNFYL